jgi:hypothetical protein
MIARTLRTLVVCLVLSACAGFQAVEGGMPVNVGGDLTVDPQVAWANAFGPNIAGRVWTIDGLGLNELRFLTRIEPGRPLMEIPGATREEMAVYQQSMLPNDVMDLVASTLGRVGHQQVRTSGLRPVPFGSGQGFRFDLDFVNGNGLEMKGMAMAAQRNGALDLILFFAPAEYYFDHHAPTVERVFASVRTTG